MKKIIIAAAAFLAFTHGAARAFAAEQIYRHGDTVLSVRSSDGGRGARARFKDLFYEGPGGLFLITAEDLRKAGVPHTLRRLGVDARGVKLYSTPEAAAILTDIVDALRRSGKLPAPAEVAARLQDLTARLRSASARLTLLEAVVAGFTGESEDLRNSLAKAAEEIEQIRRTRAAVEASLNKAAFYRLMRSNLSVPAARIGSVEAALAPHESELRQ